MALVTATNFVYITLCVYSACRVLMLIGSMMVWTCLNTMCWAAFYSLMMYLIIHKGHFSKREVGFCNFQHKILITIKLQALKTANFLHKIANYDDKGVLSSQIMMFSQQLLHRIPTFSCGLFTFDLSLAFKVKLNFRMLKILMFFNYFYFTDDKCGINLFYNFNSI